jgi:hypothetical protein
VSSYIRHLIADSTATNARAEEERAAALASPNFEVRSYCSAVSFGSGDSHYRGS